MPSKVKRSIYLQCTDIRDPTIQELAGSSHQTFSESSAAVISHWCIIVKPGTHGAYDTHELFNDNGGIKFHSNDTYTLNEWTALDIQESRPVGETFWTYNEIVDAMNSGLFPRSW